MDITKTDLNKTVYPKPQALEKDRKWYIVDAKGQTLWRMAVEIAKRLMGKHKPHYTEFWDCGDYVIVTNIKDIKVTGNKMTDKMYYWHSGYKGHLKKANLDYMMRYHPDRVIKLAVQGMLPKNKLRKIRMKRLKVFEWTTDKYNNLSPEKLEING